jgi:hypothetical protein
MKRSIASVAAGVLWTGCVILGAQPALSQAQPQAPQAASPAANVSDQKLDQAAAAIQSVTQVQKSYQQKLSAASPDQKDQIVTEANAALKKAVTDQGLSPEEYNSIIDVAQNDPTVRERLVQRLAAAKQQ